KPVYHALLAYQGLGADRLPAQTSGASGVGALAAAPGGTPHLLVWNSGTTGARVHVTVPPEWQGRSYAATLFDATHNNPQATGDDRVSLYAERAGGDLFFDLAPGSVLVLTGK